MGGARQPTRSGFSETIPAFNVEDSALSRLTNNIKSALQPLLDVFTGSPESAKIRWGKGVPTITAPAGSIHFQTDAATTAASSVFVRSNPTSAIWNPISQGIGNVLYFGTDSQVVPTTAGSWATTASGPGSGVVAMVSSGSIQAFSICMVATGGSFDPIPLPLTTGAITASLFIDGRAVGHPITLTPSSGPFVIAYFNPGEIPYKPGSVLCAKTFAVSAARATNLSTLTLGAWGS